MALTNCASKKHIKKDFKASSIFLLLKWNPWELLYSFASPKHFHEINANQLKI